MSLISIVIPVYNEEELIVESYKRIRDALRPLEEGGDKYELIFVNDGSRDKSNVYLVALAKEDARVKLISFSRNFGHQTAITAGMDYASGDAIVVIDADMQDPPSVILEMVAKWREGYDVVYGKRRKRAGETAFKKATASLYYRMLNSMTEVELPVDTGDFRLLSKQVCDALKELPERNRYVRGLVSWVGFRQTAVEYDRDSRLAGETKYSMGKMIKLAMDGVLSFSYSPIRTISHVGGWLTVLGATASILSSLRILHPDYIFLTFPTFLVGILMLSLGTVGEYMTRIVDEVRGRPRYIIREKMGFEKEAPARSNAKASVASKKDKEAVQTT
jgi:dolichol-phosphate mannosyltransferase